MSYLLSALQKAEHQRNQNTANDGREPGLLPVDADTGAPGRRLPLPALLAIPLFVVMVAAVLFFFFSNDDPGTAVGPPSADSVAPEPAAPRLTKSMSATKNPTVDKTAVVKKPPKLAISGYIFHENAPEFSRIFIDGQVYRPGSRSPAGIWFREFRSDAVVVEYQGVSHLIPVN